MSHYRGGGLIIRLLACVNLLFITQCATTTNPLAMIIIKAFDSYTWNIMIEWVVDYRRFVFGKIPNSNLHPERGHVTMFFVLFLSLLI